MQAADEAAAIDVLLLTSDLFRVDDVALRKVYECGFYLGLFYLMNFCFCFSYVGLTESVKAKGGSVHIFSTLHPSGEQLRGLTGVAAVLRFPMDLSHVDQELDDDSRSGSSSDSSSSSSSESSSEDGEEQHMFNVLKGQ